MLWQCFIQYKQSFLYVVDMLSITVLKREGNTWQILGYKWAVLTCDTLIVHSKVWSCIICCTTITLKSQLYITYLPSALLKGEFPMLKAKFIVCGDFMNAITCHLLVLIIIANCISRSINYCIIPYLPSFTYKVVIETFLSILYLLLSKCQ